MCSMTPQHVISCRHLRGSIKTRFAYRFLRALRKLSNPRTKETTTFRRYHTVKLASYVSMASAVGSSRAWSRAFLRKVRNRRLVSRSFGKLKRKSNPSWYVGEFEKEKELMRLVPGGEKMDFCSLLDETAHYIKCLTSQVQIMRKFVDLSSS